MTADLDLLTQARVVFVMLTLCLIIAVVEAKWNRGKQGARSRCSAGYHLAVENANEYTDAAITLSDRLHVLLTLFLITQTRAPNVPLFLLLEVQRLCFTRLLSQPTAAAHRISGLINCLHFTPAFPNDLLRLWWLQLNLQH